MIHEEATEVIRDLWRLASSLQRNANIPDPHAAIIRAQQFLVGKSAIATEAREGGDKGTLCKVDEIGFVHHPRIDMAGCSPDGLVADDGLVELKCPMSATHIDILLGGSFPDKYVKQALWQMACTGKCVGWSVCVAVAVFLGVALAVQF